MAARSRRRRAASKLRFRRWLRRRKRPTRGLALALVALTILVVALVAPRLGEKGHDTEITRSTPAVEKKVKTTARRAATARTPAAQPHRKVKASAPPKAPTAAARATRASTDGVHGARAAIVIDDLGQSYSHFEQVAGLNIPLSIAIIPGLPASARTANAASQRGIEVLLHQPMEPHAAGGKSPGEGALLISMTAEDLRSQVRANLAALPGAVGVNNHMGSRFTEDAAGLGALMAEIYEHRLFWLDSRTTAGTRGVEVAHAVGVPALERDIFIDAEVNVDFIRRQLRRLIRIAQVHGTAVGIGHPHPETIAILRELRAELLASGVALVPASALVPGYPGPALATAQAGGGWAGERAVKLKAATP